MMSDEKKIYTHDMQYDVTVIGAGPAGLAAAIQAKKQGVEKVAIIERDCSLGGILQQCIHPGFGLQYFKQELTGPEYAYRFIEDVHKYNIDVILNTMVLDIQDDNIIHAVNSKYGVCTIKSKSIVLAMGCRERTRAAIGIPGTRPAGIFTAGTAQRFINMQGYMIGKKVVILGSGDIGMIMARRLTLEGAKVEAVVEILPYLTGLTRNKVQCLDDFDIPLLFSHTVIDIKGTNRVEAVTIAKVDQNFKPILSTKRDIQCDTLLLSIGLIPENEITKTAGIKIDNATGGPIVDNMMQTTKRGVFACGNVVHVNDLVDNVTVESQLAGKYAALYSQGKIRTLQKHINIIAGDNIRYTVPQRITMIDEKYPSVNVYYRVTKPMLNTKIQAVCQNKVLADVKRLKSNPGEIESIKISISDVQKDITLNAAEGGE